MMIVMMRIMMMVMIVMTMIMRMMMILTRRIVKMVMIVMMEMINENENVVDAKGKFLLENFRLDPNAPLR